ncbi:MAG: DUF1588 domain-containing protein, partial [Myxococcales bacterium]|nr:DUF1588 domain-containing protein [Myxococcales bacterium]
GLLGRGAVQLNPVQGANTNVVARGNWVLETLLCMKMPPPPPDDEVAIVESTIEQDNPTPREISEARRSNAGCAGCHAVMDELGFALEQYDGFGQERAEYGEGVAVDSKGKLPNGQSFNDAAGLATLIAETPAFRMCVAKQFGTYLLGRQMNDAESCRVRQTAFAAPVDVGLQDLLLSVTEQAIYTSMESQEP